MTDLAFHRDGWLEATLGDAAEDATFTRLQVRFGNTLLTRNFSKRGGGENDGINVPLYPLVRMLAESWWPLLYEPLRPISHERFRARHRLDAAMHGYVFPPLALCSAGEDVIAVDWLLENSDLASIEFLTPPPPEPVLLNRTQSEGALMDLVETVLSRLNRDSRSFIGLRDAWNRVTNSIHDLDELSYCVAAGRLGIDPYDPGSPDLSDAISGLSPGLVNDLSEAVELAELNPATQWVQGTRFELSNAPQIEIGALGDPVSDDLSQPAWVIGGRAANQLRNILGLDINRPRRAVQQLLDGAVRPNEALSQAAPTSIVALVSSQGDSARIAAVAKSARQQRFRACAATYIAWSTRGTGDRAATVALTRVQQASRAFAAELLAPRQLLKDRAGRFGLTAETIAKAADDFICPHDAVVLQAFNGGIPMRGVEVPAYRRISFA
jgi:hypothetical protein